MVDTKGNQERGDAISDQVVGDRLCKEKTLMQAPERSGRGRHSRQRGNTKILSAIQFDGLKYQQEGI